MPFPENTSRAPRRMDTSVAEAMKSRLEKSNLSELGVNWIRKSHLNAGASDASYKYHIIRPPDRVAFAYFWKSCLEADDRSLDYAAFNRLPRSSACKARLGDVYRGRSTLDNDTPRDLKNPPPWANLDRRILTPIPDKQYREARWDSNFFRGNFPMSRTRDFRAPFSNKRSSSARQRPASAGVRWSNEVESRFSGAVRQGKRSSSANARGQNVYGKQNGDDYGGMRNNLGWFYEGATSTRRGISSGERDDRPGEGYRGRFCGHRWKSGGSGGVLYQSQEERNILEGTYTLDETQKATFRTFVAMLVDFDTCIAVRILDDAFIEAQLASGLQDFTGYVDD